jgi:hypothetical protein
VSCLRIFNLVEAIFWAVVAACVLVRYLKRPVSRLEPLYAVAFLCFAVSDLVESEGRWHNPWFVAWQVANFLLLLVLALHIERRRQRRKRH